MAQPGSFRDLLTAEYQKRAAANARYSLRAFARDVDVSPPFISQIMSGKRRLSEDRAEEIGQRLQWTSRRRATFLKFVRAELTRSKSTRDRLLKEASYEVSNESNGANGLRPDFKSVSIDTFRFLSDWYHFSILELTRIKGADFSPREIAKRLSISVPQATSALARLKNMKLLSETPANGETDKPTFRKTMDNYSTGNIPSGAIRSFHRQMLKKALTALLDHDPIERDFSGITMAIDPAHIPLAKKRIAAFRRELMAELEAKENPTALYHFSAQFFRLDRDAKKEQK